MLLENGSKAQETPCSIEGKIDLRKYHERRLNGGHSRVTWFAPKGAGGHSTYVEPMTLLYMLRAAHRGKVHAKFMKVQGTLYEMSLKEQLQLLAMSGTLKDFWIGTDEELDEVLEAIKD